MQTQQIIHKRCVTKILNRFGNADTWFIGNTDKPSKSKVSPTFSKFIELEEDELVIMETESGNNYFIITTMKIVSFYNNQLQASSILHKPYFDTPCLEDEDWKGIEGTEFVHLKIDTNLGYYIDVELETGATTVAVMNCFITFRGLF
jgi:hypothetical protein